MREMETQTRGQETETMIDSWRVHEDRLVGVGWWWVGQRCWRMELEMESGRWVVLIKQNY